MLRMRRKRQVGKMRIAQAAAELAIFGSLIIVILNMIITYGQRTMYNNEVKAEAFRKALQRAYYHNATVSYRLRKDSRIGSAMGRVGQDAAANASAQVMWQKGLGGAQGASGRNRSFGYYEVNDSIIIFPKTPKWMIDDTGEEQVQWVPVSGYKEAHVRRTQEETREIKREDADAITNIVETDISDTLDIDIDTRVDTYKYDSRDSMVYQLPDYRYEGQPYEVEDETYWVSGAIPGQLTLHAQQESDGTVYYEAGAAGSTAPTLRRRREWITEHGLEQEE